VSERKAPASSKELFEAVRREPVTSDSPCHERLVTSWAGEWPAIWEREHAQRWRVLPNGNLEPKARQ
jgi:hypothetical protein